MNAPARPVVNATAVEVAADAGAPPGFRTRYRQLGPLLGGELLGGTVYEFDPGTYSSRSNVVRIKNGSFGLVVLGEDSAGGFDAVELRHADVHQDNVGAQLAG